MKAAEVEPVADRIEGTDIILLRTEDVVLDEVTDVRPWAKSSEDEDKALKGLAGSIARDGQLQPIIVREAREDGKFPIIAGHRRLAAITFGNATGLFGEEKFVIASVLQGVSDEDAMRKAIIENSERLQMSPMDVALNIVKMRDRMGLTEDKSWSRTVGDMLGKSRSFVTQKMKLLEELSPTLQKKVHQGKVAEDAALMLMKVEEEQVAEVLEAAEADAEAEEKQERKGKGGGARKAKVLEKHVEKAARAKDALKEKVARSRKQIIESFEQFDSGVYGYEDSSVRKFVRFFVDQYVKGEGSETKFKRLFNAMIEGAFMGSAPEEPEVESEVKPKRSKK